VNPKELSTHIRERTELAAYTAQDSRISPITFHEKHRDPYQFRDCRGARFFYRTAIAGQTFYNFTLENIRYFGTLKAMGATNGILLRMILLQALLVGSLGYGLGVGGASLFGYLLGGTELAFRLTTDLLIFSGAAICLIIVISALISIRKVMKLEPAIVFKA